MEWDPPSADGVKVLDIVPTYVGTHRLTGDVHTGGMRAQPLSYTLTSISTYVPIVILRASLRSASCYAVRHLIFLFL